MSSLTKFNLNIVCWLRRSMKTVKMRTRKEETGPTRWTFCCQRLVSPLDSATSGGFRFVRIRMAEVSELDLPI